MLAVIFISISLFVIALAAVGRTLIKKTNSLAIGVSFDVVVNLLLVAVTIFMSLLAWAYAVSYSPVGDNSASYQSFLHARIELYKPIVSLFVITFTNIFCSISDARIVYLRRRNPSEQQRDYVPNNSTQQYCGVTSAQNSNNTTNYRPNVKLVKQAAPTSTTASDDAIIAALQRILRGDTTANSPPQQPQNYYPATPQQHFEDDDNNPNFFENAAMNNKK